MVPMAGLMPGPQELIIILIIVLLLFGGSRLAGLGKSTGRAIKEFKEETKGLKSGDTPPAAPGATAPNPYQTDAGSTFVPGPPQAGVSYPQPQQNGAKPPAPQYNDAPYVAPPQGTQGINGTPYGQPPQGQPTEHDVRRDV